MPSTLALRRRIKTAQNISKTTRAMQMIAASKLKRAQQAALASRPYVDILTLLTKSVREKENSDAKHPLLRNTTTNGKTLYIVISPDKGLCGGLNTNLFREYLKYHHDEKSLFMVVGKKIEALAASTTKNLVASFHAGTTLPSFDMVPAISDIVTEYFKSEKVDNVKIITTHFNSVFSQSPKVTQLLPIVLEEEVLQKQQQKETMPTETGEKLIEPSPDDLLPALLSRYIDMVIFQQLLESYASFQAAQMIAMQNATNNAKDIVADLTLLYNKVRQEKITNEILDISSAAVAIAAN